MRRLRLFPRTSRAFGLGSEIYSYVHTSDSKFTLIAECTISQVLIRFLFRNCLKDKFRIVEPRTDDLQINKVRIASEKTKSLLLRKCH